MPRRQIQLKIYPSDKNEKVVQLHLKRRSASHINIIAEIKDEVFNVLESYAIAAFVRERRTGLWFLRMEQGIPGGLGFLLSSKNRGGQVLPASPTSGLRAGGMSTPIVDCLEGAISVDYEAELVLEGGE